MALLSRLYPHYPMFASYTRDISLERFQLPVTLQGAICRSDEKPSGVAEIAIACDV